MTCAYPLEWPDGWPRTQPADVRRAAYTVSQDRAQRELANEVRLLGGTHLVISTNIPTRQDGMPYARHPRIDDPGVAVYFMWEGEQRVIACDQWDLIKDNVRAIGLSVGALRMIQRCGASSILERAFQGFGALPPPPAGEHWMEVLELGHSCTREELERQFKILAQENHPDRPNGSQERFQELVRARDVGRLALEGRAFYER